MKDVNFFYKIAGILALIVFLILFIKPSILKSIKKVKYITFFPTITIILAVISTLTFTKSNENLKIHKIKNLNEDIYTIDSVFNYRNKLTITSKSNINKILKKINQKSSNSGLQKSINDYNNLIDIIDTNIINNKIPSKSNLKSKLNLIYQEILRLDSKSINIGLNSADKKVILELISQINISKDQYNTLKIYYDKKYWYPIIIHNDYKPYAIRKYDEIRKIDSTIPVMILSRKTKNGTNRFAVALGIENTYSNSQEKLKWAYEQNLTEDGYSLGSDKRWDVVITNR